MTNISWTKTQIALAGATLAYVVTFIVALLFHYSGQHDFKAFSNYAQLIPPIFAGGCSLYYAQRAKSVVSSRRAGWAVLGIGCLSYALGQALFTYYDLNNIKAFPSLADAAFFAAYPFWICGVILLFGSLPITGRARLILESAIAASSVGIIVWHFLIEKFWQISDATPLAKYLSVTYPFADVLILFCALVLVGASSHQARLRWPHGLLAAGVGLFAFTDMMWNYYTLKGTYETGSWIDPGWPFGFLLIAYAPLLLLWQHNGLGLKQGFSLSKIPEAPPEFFSPAPAHTPAPSRITASLVARILLPYAASLLAWCIVAYHDYQTNSSISTSTFITGFWLMFLVLSRQVLTAIENQFLTAQLRVFNANLEHTVAYRTHQLTSLYELTKAVNNTLQAEQALTQAVDYTIRAFQADAVVINLAREVTSANKTLRPSMQRGLDDRPEIAELLSDLPLTARIEEIELAKIAGARFVQIGAPEITILPENEAATSDNAPQAVYLRAPLLHHERVLGSIGVVRWSGGFSSTESAMLESIGIEVAVAFRNAQTHAVAVENADRDPVTELFNHRAIHGRLDIEIKRAEREKRPLAIIMMDLNNFKLFNDTYGHPVGDQVLKRVASVLQANCRKLDILGRYGGDEFIAILPDTDLPLAMVTAQVWRDRMALEGFHQAGEERAIPVALSYGIATYPTDSSNRYELLSIADANLYTAKISDRTIVSSSEAQREHRQLRAESSFDVLDAMVNAVDNKDHYTRRHSEDVTEFALWIAEELGLSEGTMRLVRMSALLHDVGKIGVPESILRKPGRLTDEEFAIMKQHPQFGAYIVGGVPGMEQILDGVRSHHERWDGKGYPDGLAADAIPFMGRLLAVADACSAMTTARPYRKALSWESALNEINANIETQFDPVMAHAFLRAAHRHRPLEVKTSHVLQLVEKRKLGEGGVVEEATASSGKAASS